MDHMEYIFGTKGEIEVLKTKGGAHTDLTGWQQVEQAYEGRETVTDRFRVVRKLDSKRDQAGNCYDWYEIDRHYRTIDKSSPAEAEAKRAAAAAGTAFAALAEAGAVDDTTAGEYTDLFPEWAAGVSYPVKAIRRRNEALYRCVQAHTSQEGWEPEKVPALWEKIERPGEEQAP